MFGRFGPMVKFFFSPPTPASRHYWAIYLTATGHRQVVGKGLHSWASDTTSPSVQPFWIRSAEQVGLPNSIYGRAALIVAIKSMIAIP